MFDKYKKIGITLGILTSLFFVVVFVFSFTPPTQGPPFASLLPPIDITSTAQHKEGALGIGGILTANTGMLVNPHNDNIWTERPTCSAEAGTRGTIWTENQVEGTTNVACWESDCTHVSGTSAELLDNNKIKLTKTSDGEWARFFTIKYGQSDPVGSIELSDGESLTVSFNVLENDSNIRMDTSIFLGAYSAEVVQSSIILYPGFFSRTYTNNSGVTQYVYYRFNFYDAWDIKQGDYIVIKNYQEEKKSLATPFVDGTREEVPSDIIYTCQKTDADTYQWVETAPNWRKSVATTLNEDLVGHWTFNEHTTSGNFAYDYSGNANTARSFGPYLDFNGTSDYVLLPHRLKDGTLTISFWFKPSTNWTSGSGRKDFIYYHSESSTGHITLNRENDGKIGWYILTNNFTNLKVSPTSWSSVQWYFLTFSYDGTTGRAYLNGALETEITDTIRSFDFINGIDLGGSTQVNTWVNGQIDDARIYNRALSTTEIEQLYEGRYHDTTGLVGHWKMDEMADGTCDDLSDVCDSSGNENHGTNNGATWTAGTAPTRTAVGPGHAFTFDGVDDYVEVSPEVFPDISNGTVSFWTYINRSNMEDKLGHFAITNKHAGGNKGWHIGLDDRGSKNYELRIGLQDSSGWIIDTTSDMNNFFPDIKWYHVVYSWVGNDYVAVHLDGNEIFSQNITRTPIASNLPLYIGGEPNQNWYLSAAIDDVRIYNRALSADEVKYLYETTAPNYE